ncbi:MAG: hypothetical protein M1817_002649 [Caeruleum heppii]|nr:MAG: hypothetical protein M1817_002649 [Caeruleum heppii]
MSTEKIDDRPTVQSSAEDRDDQASAFAKEYIRLSAQYREGGDVADLNEAVRQITQAVDVVQDTDDKAGYLNNLGRIHRIRFERSFQHDDLDRAVEAARQSVAVMDPKSGGAPLFLANLSDTLSTRYSYTTRNEDLQEAVEVARRSVEASSSVGRFRGETLETLASRLSTLYHRDGDVNSLSESIDIGLKLVQEIPEDDANHAIYSNNLANSLESRYKLGNDAADLEDCLRYSQKAVDETPINHIIRCQFAVTRNEYLRIRAERTRSSTDLDALIRGNEELLREIPLDHQHRPTVLMALARALGQRYLKVGSRQDLDRAIVLGGTAVAVEDLSPKRRATALKIQGKLLQDRGELEDLNVAVRMNREALDLPGEGSLPRIDNLVGLSGRLSKRFDLTGQLCDIEEAIALAREVVALAPQDHAERPAWLHNLGLFLRGKARVTDTTKYLDEAIEISRQAIGAVGADHIDVPMMLDGLSTSLAMRYRMTGTSVDLEDAIQAARVAVASTEPGNVDRQTYLNSLSNRLCNRYDAWKDPADIEEAIAAVSDALTAAPDDIVYLDTLGNALHSQYEVTGDKESLEESLVYAQRAVDLLPESGNRRALYLYNLGLRFMSKFCAASRRDFDALHRAIKYAEASVDATPVGHPDLPGYVTQLAHCLAFGAEEEMLQDDLAGVKASCEKAVSLYQRSINDGKAPTESRIRSGRNAGLVMMFNEQWTAAYENLKQTVILFQRLSPRSLAREDQQRLLHGFSGVSAWAASAALNAEIRAADALDVLEAGRGIIASLAMNVRNEVSDLALVHPGLASDYDLARAAISAMPQSIDANSPQSSLKYLAVDSTKLREQRIAKLEQIEKEIRLQPGFDRFQLPPTAKQLMDLAEPGPIVCFNVTNYRSDAFLVTRDRIESINLPDLKESELKANVQRINGQDRLSKSSMLEKSQSNKEMRRILRWLWDVAVRPVLLKLELLTPAAASKLPRLWWVTSGYMGLVPLHAAGDYEKVNSKECAANYIVSSYIPTFKALVYARAREARARDGQQKNLLIVSMPTTPAGVWPPLNVGSEIDAIKRSYEAAQGIRTELAQPSAHDVLDRMNSHSIVHFACHGDPDINDPSKSSLILCKDPQTIDRLTVGQLSRITATKAQLAYLSACCTAQHYSAALMDEVIHLGSAFQLIGYPSVIGTLWEADDYAAAHVAEAFYEQFATAKTEEATSDVAARALHQATLKLRDQRRGRVRRPDHDAIGWAPFIHIGA